MYYTIEETLNSVDLPEGLLPHLLYPKVLEGARKAQVYLGMASEDDSLVGKDGTTIKFVKSTQISAGDVDADTFEANPSFTDADPTITQLDVSVTKQQSVKFSLSKILMENLPSVNMDLVQLQNAANAMVEKLNADIRDVVAVSGAPSAPVPANHPPENTTPPDDTQVSEGTVGVKLPIEYVIAAIAVAIVGIAAAWACLFLKRKKPVGTSKASKT